MAKMVIALIFTLIILASLQSPACAAEIIEPKPKLDTETKEPRPKPADESTKPRPKPDTLGGFSVSSTIGSFFFAGSEQRNITPLYGVKVGHEKIGKSAAENLGVEATLNYFSSRSKADTHDTSGYLFRLDASYPFPIKKTWIPYIVVGAGGLFSDSNGTTNKNFLLNYGVGLKYFIENYLAVRVDARHLGIYENSIFRQNFDVGLGLSYYFGKERIKKSVVPPVTPPKLEKKKIEVLEDAPLKKVEDKKPDVTDKVVGDDVATVLVIPPGKIDVIKKVSVEFDSNSSYIKPIYFIRFKEFAVDLNGSVDLSVHIVRDVDVTGMPVTDPALAEQMVQSVRDSLIKYGVSPKQISIISKGSAVVKPVVHNSMIAGKHQDRRVDILLVKLDEAARLKADLEFQFEIERNEIERLQSTEKDKESIKATLELQKVSEVLAVDSAAHLAFEFINKGENTAEYVLTVVAPKDFDGFLSSASRPDDKVTLLQLAPGEKFKGNLHFRIPAGMDDGQISTLTIKAVSTRFNDVVFQQDSQIVASAPLLKIETKLGKRGVNPGVKVRYRVVVLNAGSLSARNLSIRVQLPPQVDFVGSPDTPFTLESDGFIVFKVDTIESGKQTEIKIDVNVKKDIKVGQELFWISEVIDGTLQRRAKTTERATVVP